MNNQMTTSSDKQLTQNASSKNDHNSIPPTKSNSKHTNKKTTFNNLDLNNSSNHSNPKPIRSTHRTKTVQHLLPEDFETIIYPQKDNTANLPEKNKNKLTCEFRPETKFKHDNSKGLGEHPPSLKDIQSIRIFQKEQLPHLLNTSFNKSKFIKKISDERQINESLDNDMNDEMDDLSPNKIKNKRMGVSQAGKYENNVAKENQDSLFVLNEVLGLEDFHIYGVMDGHGTNGHFVSGYIKKNAEEYFTNEQTYCISKKNKQILTSSLIYDKIVSNDNAIIKFFFNHVNNRLINEKFDVHFSGSTCVIVFHIGSKLICANVGDSRAIAVKDNRSTVDFPSSDPFAYFKIISLSNDHKPELPEEKERIEKMGGIVHQSIEKDGTQNGPFRVFIKGQKVPGIAMSRSLGDEVAESLGVIHTPEITLTDVTDTFKYIVLASDGVWEFLSNEKVISIINPHFFRNDIKAACRAAIAEATSWWKKEDPSIDDITIVLAFLGRIHIKKCTV